MDYTSHVPEEIHSHIVFRKILRHVEDIQTDRKSSKFIHNEVPTQSSKYHKIQIN